jgi:hypothetical protein
MQTKRDLSFNDKKQITNKPKPDIKSYFQEQNENTNSKNSINVQLKEK